MHISRAIPAILLWLQAVTAAPAPLERRQVSVLKDAISKVTGALETLDTAIQGLDASDLSTATPLLNSVEGAQKTLTEASASIKGAQNVGLLDAVGLLQPANDLTAQVQKTLGDLTAKKPVFDQLGVSPVVADALKQQKVAANDLSDAMFSKLPAIAQTLAGGTADTLNKAVDDAIKAFEAPPAAPAPKPGTPAPSPPGTPAPAPKPDPPAPAPKPDPPTTPAPAPPATPVPAPKPAPPAAPAPKPSSPAAPASPLTPSTPNTAPKVAGSVPLSPQLVAGAF